MKDRMRIIWSSQSTIVAINESACLSLFVKLGSQSVHILHTFQFQSLHTKKDLLYKKFRKFAYRVANRLMQGNSWWCEQSQWIHFAFLHLFQYQLYLKIEVKGLKKERRHSPDLIGHYIYRKREISIFYFFLGGEEGAGGAVTQPKHYQVRFLIILFKLFYLDAIEVWTQSGQFY